jgi:signal transduction histidine kinase
MNQENVPGAWSSAQRLAALSFVAATLPLGIGVGILLAPVERPPLSTVLVSWALVMLVLGAGAWLLRRQRQRRQPAAADDLVFGLLDDMSHELRTPLNSIIGFSELLLSETEQRLSTRHRQYLADVLGSGQQLLSVVNDLLELSRVTTGARPLKRESLLPADLVAGAFELLAAEAEAREVTLVARDRSSEAVLGDRLGLGKALGHLVQSALRFSPAGASVEVESHDDGGDISFSIRDHGPARDGALAPGTGLGLLISRRLIEEHGGQLVLEPAPGGGNIVRFHVPAIPRRTLRLLPHPGVAS